MNTSVFEIKTYDGLRLHARRWIPEGSVRAVICLVHGLGEHSGRYAHVAEAFNAAGYAVYALDLRGHGLSEGKRGHASGFTALMDDIGQLLECAAGEQAGLPLFLYGHSLGGSLVIYYALRRMARLAGVIAASPLIRLTVPPEAHRIQLSKALCRIWPSLTLSNGIDRAALSRDEAIVDAYRGDPLVHDRVSVRLGLDMLRSGIWNLRHAPDLRCPMLVMHGREDRITSPKASHDFCVNAGEACAYKLWLDCAHELHNEPERRKVFDFVIDWIDGRIGT